MLNQLNRVLTTTTKKSHSEMVADNDTLTQAEEQLNRAALELGAMAQDVADAKVVREYSGDRQKQALSVSVAAFLKGSMAVSAAEHMARGSAGYASTFATLQAQYQAAMRVIEKYEATKAKFEAARSILSVEKAKIGLM